MKDVWIQEYLDLQKTVLQERRLYKFMMVMYPTGWHHYGYRSCQKWAMAGLKELGWL